MTIWLTILCVWLALAFIGSAIVWVSGNCARDEETMRARHGIREPAEYRPRQRRSV